MAIRIEDLIRPVEPLDPELSLGEAARRLSARPEIPGLPVAFDGLVVGIVCRNSLLSALSLAGDQAALRAAPVTRAMQRDPFLVDMKERAVVVARRASQVAPERLRAGIVATHGQSCVGMLEAGDLIRALSSENTTVVRTRTMDRDQAGELVAKIRRMEDERRQLLALIGHEMRTPLNALMGHGERLQLAANERDRRDSAKAIMDGCASMDTILSRLLETGLSTPGRNDAGRTQTLRLKTLACELQSLWSARADEVGARLRVSALRSRMATFRINDAGLRQILNNLVSNALKYACEGEIRVELELAETRSGADLLARVIDEGPGINDAEKLRIFEPRHRIDTYSHAAPGHGLGLHLARETAIALGGELGVEDAESGGAVFVLRLPVEDAGTENQPETQRARRLESITLGDVLLVEDHAPSLALARAALESAGWQVDIALNLAQAMRRAMHKPYQAIICDIHLPDGDGTNLAHAVRREPGPNHATAIMALSADNSAARRETCTRAGFSFVAHKPLKGSQLVALVLDMIVAAGPGDSARRSG